MTRKGMDLADKTYKVTRHRIVWLLAHPVQAHGEGVGFVSGGSKGCLCFCNCSMGCSLVGYAFLSWVSCRLTASKET